MKGSKRGVVVFAVLYALMTSSLVFAEGYDHETKVQDMSFFLEDLTGITCK